MKRINLVKKSFGRLTVLSFGGCKNKKLVWVCLCICGNKTFVTSSDLRTGHTKSCGCLSRELIKLKSKTHGKRYSDEYRCWCKMKERCLNKKNKNYNLYGGRGISICDRWLNSFSNFFSDMGARPSKSHSINRLDNDGDYTPENCVWATPTEQARNRKSSRVLTHGAVSKPLIEWANDFCVNPSTILGHFKRGKSFEEIYFFYQTKNNPT